ncbi:MAG: energy-coupling factor ABC transporter permease, partial [Candidatus Desantisbacteria bacterium]
MHLSEGILPMGWAAFWYLAALPFVGYGVYKVKNIS